MKPLIYVTISTIALGLISAVIAILTRPVAPTAGEALQHAQNMEAILGTPVDPSALMSVSPEQWALPGALMALAVLLVGFGLQALLLTLHAKAVRPQV
jgi:hypothetical protein